jgi:hypothetical protein
MVGHALWKRAYKEVAVQRSVHRISTSTALCLGRHATHTSQSIEGQVPECLMTADWFAARCAQDAASNGIGGGAGKSNAHKQSISGV